MSVSALLICLVVIGSMGLVASSAGDAVAASPVCDKMQSPVHVSIKPSTGSMLVTASAHEASRARTTYGYTEGHGSPFAVSATPRPGLVPVYRLYNPANYTFMWTIWPSEVSSAHTKYGWRNEGVYFYAAAKRTDSCQVQIDRLYKDGVFRVAVAGSPDEQAWVKRGWHKQQGTFFASPTPASDAETVGSRPATPTPTPKPTATPNPTQPEQSADGKPAAITGTMYLNKKTLAWHAYETATDRSAKRDLYNIAATPTAAWLTGSSSDVARVRSIVSAAAKGRAVPQFVLYAIPDRDCGGYSAGGQSNAAAYRSWINQVVAAIGNSRAIVILEPDAISFCGNNSTVRSRRTALLTYAAKRLHDNAPNVAAYLHAGSGQLSYSYVVSAMKESGIAYLRGVAMNVSSHGGTTAEQKYADELMKKLAAAGVPGKHYVVDTSRNGVPSPPNPGGTYNSCNNPNAALGTRPTSHTTSSYADAYLWIKSPGESDGRCHPGDPTGWFPKLARGLVANARTHHTITYWTVP